jgi:hypothetical protein
MIEKRRKLQTFETNVENHEETIDDKKSKATSILSIVFSLLFVTIFVFYMSKIDLKAAISSPSTYKLSTADLQMPLKILHTTSSDSNTMNIPDAERPTIVHAKTNGKSLRSFEKSSELNQLTAVTVLPVQVTEPTVTLETLTQEVTKQIEKLSKMKREQQIVMETSDIAKSEIAILQKQLQTLIPLKYGPGPYQLEMTLRFPDSMVTDPSVQLREETILVDMAPIAVVPYSVYYFLGIVTDWKVGVVYMM